MSTRELVLHLSIARVTVRLHAIERAATTLSAVWRAAMLRPVVPPRLELTYEAAPSQGGYEVRFASGHSRVFAEDIDVAPAIEAALYNDLLYEHQRAGLCVLHASCVVEGQRAFVFFGESGAGKSTMARKSVEAGLDYFGDEHVISDGHALWGLPRSIHLDQHPVGAAPLPWHAGADSESYVVRDPENRWLVSPLVHVAEARIARAPARVTDVVLVALRHGEHDEASPLSTAERLLALGNNCWVRSPALGALVTGRHAFRLTWRDPEAALARLRSLAT